MRMDDFLPAYHFHEVHALRMQASPERIFQAVKAVTAKEIKLLLFLMGVRALPALLLGRARPRGKGDRPILEVATESGFLVLAEEANRELVLGTIGRFWKLLGAEPVRIADAQEFLAFHQPGYAKVAMNFCIEDAEDRRTRVTTETRIYATDAEARKKFGLYWRIVHPGSALIRRMWLRAIQKRAEKRNSHG